ncbi:MAG: peptidoglycan DD-metalloendopeptidase family protein [Bacteroidales bacterium]|nr:peptidoglycan DD-metalloendopeptidase family protein [Bacteroidales bacterium]
MKRLRDSETARLRAVMAWGLVVLLSCCLAGTACAQSKQQLEKDKAAVEQELKQLNKDLAKAKKSSKAGQQQLNLLEKKIQQRTKLINNIGGQLNVLNVQMEQTKDSIALMRTQVDSLKREYARVVRVLYGERGNLDKAVLILDTKSYNLAFLRTKYFRDYSRYRRRQASFIRQKEERLNEAGIALARQQQETTSLLVQEKRQKDELAKERKEQQKSLKQSKQQEKNLQAQINKKEQQKRQLQQQIQKIISEEIAKANKTGKATGGSSAASTVDVALSNDFASNKGRLPWPVYYTKVSREYGRYTHSSGGQNMNNGIDLQCKSGTSVQAIFSGTVSRVFTCPNGTRGIIVRHGEYMSVYANMGTVTVKEGGKVSTKQNLGTVYTNEDGSAEFSFQLWKGTASLNPRQWLR